MNTERIQTKLEIKTTLGKKNSNQPTNTFRSKLDCEVKLLFQNEGKKVLRLRTSLLIIKIRKVPVQTF